jgi:hypothetical protein
VTRGVTLIVALCVALSANALNVTAPLTLAVLVKTNVALAAPLATVTDAGTGNPALLDCSATVFATDPGPAIDTVQFPDWPAEIVVGLQTNDTGPAVAVKPVETVELPRVAVTVTLEDPVNAPVLAEKLAVVAFAATVTLAGTVITWELPSDSETTVPPVGAAPDSVTVQDVLAWEDSVVAGQLSPVIVGSEPVGSEPEPLAVPPVAESVSADAVAEAPMGS